MMIGGIQFCSKVTTQSYIWRKEISAVEDFLQITFFFLVVFDTLKVKSDIILINSIKRVFLDQIIFSSNISYPISSFIKTPLSPFRTERAINNY